MRVLLPPSETKHAGGDGPALDLDALSWPQLTRARRRLVSATVRLSRTPRKAASALGLGAGQREEVERNAQLRTAPTMPAIERYTGVLYDALDVRSLAAAARRRASERLWVGSALFGMLAADDPIPAYRLSAGSRLESVGSLVRVWKPLVVPILESSSAGDVLVDLRSGAYQALAPIDGAVTVRVLTERADGSRAVVSHFNKATKGHVARLLVQSRRDCGDATEVASVLAAGGLEVEQGDELQLDVITRQSGGPS